MDSCTQLHLYIVSTSYLLNLINYFLLTVDGVIIILLLMASLDMYVTDILYVYMLY